MKKILCVFLAVLMLMGISGCSCSGDVSSSDFSFGKWDGNVYTNDFAGVTFNLPEGWTYASEEQLIQMMNLPENPSLEDLSEIIWCSVLSAGTPDNNLNVQISVENALISGNENLTAEERVTATVTQTQEFYAERNTPCTAGEIETVSICGNDYSAIELTVYSNNAEPHQMHAVRRNGNYFIHIILTATSDDVDTLIGCFE